MHKNVKELEEIAESKVVNHLWKNIKKAYRNALSRLVRRAHGSGSRKRHSYPCTLPSGASGYRHYDKALLQTRKATKQLLFRIKINKSSFNFSICIIFIKEKIYFQLNKINLNSHFIKSFLFVVRTAPRYTALKLNT